MFFLLLLFCFLGRCSLRHFRHPGALPLRLLLHNVVHEILVEIALLLELHIEGSLPGEVIHDLGPQQGGLDLGPHLLLVELFTRLGNLLLQIGHLLLNFVRCDSDILNFGNLLNSHGCLKIPLDSPARNLLVLFEIFRSDKFLDFSIRGSVIPHLCEHDSVLLAALHSNEGVGDDHFDLFGESLLEGCVASGGEHLGVLRVDGSLNLLHETFLGETWPNSVGELVVELWEGSCVNRQDGDFKDCSLASKRLVLEERREGDLDLPYVVDLGPDNALDQALHVFSSLHDDVHLISRGSVGEGLPLVAVCISHVADHVDDASVAHLEDGVSIALGGELGLPVLEVLHGLVHLGLVEGLASV
mmetsp:Transcript_18462/g.38457  ORF Transcript_18462/g.38457 Transcript_18462/m.38457 type:complete len:358 (-) Transcript_18462:604-1677(-)